MERYYIFKFGQFYFAGCPLLDKDNLAKIFTTILEWKLRADSYLSDAALLTKKFVQGTLEFYMNLSSAFLPTPAKVHYTFILRDVAKIVFGVVLLKRLSVRSGRACAVMGSRGFAWFR